MRYDQTDRCPIHCSDDALMWLDEIGGRASFTAHVCEVQAGDVVARRRVGFGGFDPRGTLMMTCRDAWLQQYSAEQAHEVQS